MPLSVDNLGLKEKSKKKLDEMSRGPALHSRQSCDALLFFFGPPAQSL